MSIAPQSSSCRFTNENKRIHIQSGDRKIFAIEDSCNFAVLNLSVTTMNITHAAFGVSHGALQSP